MRNKLDKPPRIRNIALIVLVVLSIGTVFYHYVEKLRWLDSLYFSVISLATVGYGDITPKTDLGKLFTIFYVMIGIGIFAAAVNYLIKHAAMMRMEKRQEQNKQETKA